MDKALIDRLKKFRAEKNLNQTDMAKKLGIGMAMLGKIETYKHPGGPKVWDKFKLLEMENINNGYGGTHDNGHEGHKFVKDIVHDLQRELIDAHKEGKESMSQHKREIVEIYKTVLEKDNKIIELLESKNNSV